MQKVARNYLLPAGYDFEKIAGDFPRLIDGRDCSVFEQAHTNGATEARHEPQLVSIAKLEFPLLRRRNEQRGEVPATIAPAQAALTQADHVALIHPIGNGASARSEKA